MVNKLIHFHISVVKTQKKESTQIMVTTTTVELINNTLVVTTSSSSSSSSSLTYDIECKFSPLKLHRLDKGFFCILYGDMIQGLYYVPPLTNDLIECGKHGSIKLSVYGYGAGKQELHDPNNSFLGVGASVNANKHNVFPSLGLMAVSGKFPHGNPKKLVKPVEAGASSEIKVDAIDDVDEQPVPWRWSDRYLEDIKFFDINGQVPSLRLPGTVMPPCKGDDADGKSSGKSIYAGDKVVTSICGSYLVVKRGLTASSITGSTKDSIKVSGECLVLLKVEKSPLEPTKGYQIEFKTMCSLGHWLDVSKIMNWINDKYFVVQMNNGKIYVVDVTKKFDLMTDLSSILADAGVNFNVNVNVNVNVKSSTFNIDSYGNFCISGKGFKKYLHGSNLKVYDYPEFELENELCINLD